MENPSHSFFGFLETVHPYDALSRDELVRVANSFRQTTHAKNNLVYSIGEPLDGLHLIKEGEIEVSDENGQVVSLLGRGNSFGERGLARDGLAVTTAKAMKDGTTILTLPAEEFRRLMREVPAFERYFQRGRPANYAAERNDLSTQKVGDLMTKNPVTVEVTDTVRQAAQRMRDARVSCVGVVDEGAFVGIVTTRDMSNKVLAAGLSPETPVGDVMTHRPESLAPVALGTDVLALMLERRIGHVPVVDGTRLVGMITQTDLTRFQAVSASQLVREVAVAHSAEEMAVATARIPELLTQLVGGSLAHEVITRLITDIADAVTRRLLKLAEAELGPAPVPYLWLACGSQGRQEQTGVSDQDNCLMIDDSATAADMTYFASLATYVCDGLNAAGYVYCPGDMMATNPRWCQRVQKWKDYFRGWIAAPDPTAQMLASVMFDLRPIGGEMSLFRDVQTETLEAASKNSIFVAHMISNSLSHHPPLGLLRSFATIRSGEHKHHIDMKHNGVVPVVDLGRVYALIGKIPAANTRTRLQAAETAGVISSSGARDLIEAYDAIAELRLENQARLIRSGRKPDNFLAPYDLSDFERSHLRDAFVVVRTMQSAVGQSRGART